MASVLQLTRGGYISHHKEGSNASLRLSWQPCQGADTRSLCSTKPFLQLSNCELELREVGNRADSPLLAASFWYAEGVATPMWPPTVQNITSSPRPFTHPYLCSSASCYTVLRPKSARLSRKRHVLRKAHRYVGIRYRPHHPV